MSTMTQTGRAELLRDTEAGRIALAIEAALSGAAAFADHQADVMTEDRRRETISTPCQVRVTFE